VLRNDLPEMESELSCGSIFRMNFIASCSGLVSSSLNFTSTSWYASMNWSSSVSAARPSNAVRCRASISLALMALTSPPMMGLLCHDARIEEAGAIGKLWHRVVASAAVPSGHHHVQGEQQACVRRLRWQLRYDDTEGGCPWAVVVIAGPVADIEDAAREVVQDVVETAVARFQRDPADVE
jgi:hypothetical protein